MVLPCGSKTDGFKVTKTRARMKTVLSRQSSVGGGLRNRRRLGLKHSRENVVHVPELLVQIERAVDVGARQRLRDVRIGDQERLEVAAVGERPHRIPLDPLVRLFARNTL